MIPPANSHFLTSSSCFSWNYSLGLCSWESCCWPITWPNFEILRTRFPFLGWSCSFDENAHSTSFWSLQKCLSFLLVFHLYVSPILMMMICPRSQSRQRQHFWSPRWLLGDSSGIVHAYLSLLIPDYGRCSWSPSFRLVLRSFWTSTLWFISSFTKNGNQAQTYRCSTNYCNSTYLLAPGQFHAHSWEYSSCLGFFSWQFRPCLSPNRPQ